MNLLSNIKIFSSFGTMIKLLSVLVTVMKIFAGLFLGAQIITLLLKTRKEGVPLNEVIKLG